MAAPLLAQPSAKRVCACVKSRTMPEIRLVPSRWKGSQYTSADVPLQETTWALPLILLFLWDPLALAGLFRLPMFGMSIRYVSSEYASCFEACCQKCTAKLLSNAIRSKFTPFRKAWQPQCQLHLDEWLLSFKVEQARSTLVKKDGQLWLNGRPKNQKISFLQF